MTHDQVYANWHSSLKSPNDSIFYYHKSVERFMLGLAIFVISSRPLIGKLEKAKMLKILHLQVPQLVPIISSSSPKYYGLDIPFIRFHQLNGW